MARRINGRKKVTERPSESFIAKLIKMADATRTKTLSIENNKIKISINSYLFIEI